MKNPFKRTGCATRSTVCRRPNTHTASKHSDIQFAHISIHIYPTNADLSRFFPCFNNLFTFFAIFRNILCLSQKGGGQKPAVCARDAENRKRGESSFGGRVKLLSRFRNRPKSFSYLPRMRDPPKTPLRSPRSKDRTARHIRRKPYIRFRFRCKRHTAER